MNLGEKLCPKCGRSMDLVMSGFRDSTVSSFECTYCLSKMKDFEIFVKCLSIAYRGFCLNQRVHEKIETKVYRKFKKQWNTILVALEMDYKLWLAKILEKKYTHECLKNYRFTGEYKATETKIEKWRNGFLASGQ